MAGPREAGKVSQTRGCQVAPWRVRHTSGKRGELRLHSPEARKDSLYLGTGTMVQESPVGWLGRTWGAILRRLYLTWQPWGAMEGLGAQCRARTGGEQTPGCLWVSVCACVRRVHARRCDFFCLGPLQVEGSLPTLADWLHHPIHFEIFKRGLSFPSPVRVRAGNNLSAEQKGNGCVNYVLSLC